MEKCLSLLFVPLLACYGVTFIFNVSIIRELSEVLRLLRLCVFTCGSSQLRCTQTDSQTDRQTVCTASGGVFLYNLLLKIIQEDTIKRSCVCLYCSVYQEYLLDWWLMLFENSISTVEVNYVSLILVMAANFDAWLYWLWVKPLVSVGQFEQGAETFAKDGGNDSTAVVTALVLNPFCSIQLWIPVATVEGISEMTDRLFLKVACCAAVHWEQP